MFLNSKNYQIIPVHEFHAREFLGADFLAVEPHDAARKFRSVQIADAHHVVRRKVAFAARHAWW